MNKSATELLELALKGDLSSINELYKLAKLYNNYNDIRQLCPSLEILIEQLINEKRLLNSNDISLINKICLELAHESENLTKFNFNKYCKIDGLVDRITIFDSNIIEILVYFFYPNNNKIVYQKSQPFFNVCILGSYIHKIFNINDKIDKKYIIHKKINSGIFSQQVQEETEETQKLFCQPFSDANSIFMCPYLQHSVDNLESEIVNIVIRDNRERFNKLRIYQPDVNLENALEEEFSNDNLQINENEKDLLLIKEKLINTIIRFRNQLISMPREPYLNTLSLEEKFLRLVEKKEIIDIKDEKEYLYGILLICGILSCWSPDKKLSTGLQTKLELLIGKYRGTIHTYDDLNLIIESLRKTFDYETNRIFGHILWTLNLLTDIENYQDDVNYQLNTVMGFANIEMNMSTLKRLELASKWFRRNPLPVSLALSRRSSLNQEAEEK